MNKKNNKEQEEQREEKKKSAAGKFLDFAAETGFWAGAGAMAGAANYFYEFSMKPVKHDPSHDLDPQELAYTRGRIWMNEHPLRDALRAQNIGEDEKKVNDLRNEAVTMMFSLLAEDVYLNCIRDKSVDIDLRREMAMSLLLLWEHRNDEAIEQIAPVLQSIWTARRKLAPAFGTMMGTSELILISMQMDEMWTNFIKDRLSDPMVSQAMEEFLFGISFEQINALREILKGQGIKAIGRDEVSKFLGAHVKTDAGLDYRDFYSMYTLRRDNARARSRLKVSGPQKTLEDYFIQFVMKFNKEKQKNDSFAK